MNFHNLDVGHKLMYASLAAITVGGAAYGANAFDFVDLHGLTENMSLVAGATALGTAVTLQVVSGTLVKNIANTWKSLFHDNRLDLESYAHCHLSKLLENNFHNSDELINSLNNLDIKEDEHFNRKNVNEAFDEFLSQPSGTIYVFHHGEDGCKVCKTTDTAFAKHIEKFGNDIIVHRLGEHDDKIAIVTRCDGKVLDTAIIGEKVGDNWNLKLASEYPDYKKQSDSLVSIYENIM